jgi:hypothetical protein
MIIGYGASIGPNIVSNFRSGNGFTSPDLYADLMTDTAGFGVSVGGGWIGAAIPTFAGAPAVAPVGDFFGSIGVSVGWDIWVAPSVRSWIMAQVFGE